MDINSRYGFGRSGCGRGDLIKLGGLLLVTVAFMLWLQNTAREAASTDNSLAASSGHRSYFANGRWLADARTLAAAVRYLLEPEPPVLPGSVAPATIPSQPPLQAGAQNYVPSFEPGSAFWKPGGVSTNRPAKI